jgi:hypothetical protein
MDLICLREQHPGDRATPQTCSTATETLWGLLTLTTVEETMLPCPPGSNVTYPGNISRRKPFYTDYPTKLLGESDLQMYKYHYKDTRNMKNQGKQ